MTDDDATYVKKLISIGNVIHSPVLELGAGYGGKTCEALIKAAGLEYFTTDIREAQNVDYLANFEDQDCLAVFGDRSFGTILVLNVLEHVFQPIDILDHALELVRPGGTVVTITPSVWPIHNYPIDCQRLLPDWYLEYAKRRPNAELKQDLFDYVGIGPIQNFKVGDQLHLPMPWISKGREYYSKAIHKIFNTSGRTQWARSHSAIGAVFVKREANMLSGSTKQLC